jgi:hypothetical protein
MSRVHQAIDELTAEEQELLARVAKEEGDRGIRQCAARMIRRSLREIRKDLEAGRGSAESREEEVAA